jgi:hypothetical protein
MDWLNMRLKLLLPALLDLTAILNRMRSLNCTVDLSLSYGQQSVDQFVLVSGLPFGAHDQILSFPFFSDNCFNVLPVGRPF